MFKLSSDQIETISDVQKSNFRMRVDTFLEENAINWTARDPADQDALFNAATALAREREAEVERYIAFLAHSLDTAGDWRRFIATDPLITRAIHPDIDAPSFTHQVSVRAEKFRHAENSPGEVRDDG